MSDVMLHGVIEMPYDMAMSNEMSRRQFYSRAQQALRERNEAHAEIKALKSDIEGYVTVNAELMAEIDDVRSDAMRMRYLLGLSTLSTPCFHWNGSPSHADEIRADIDDAMRKMS